ncbi:hypothetical protein T265_00103 [Opisthorchis viverrini]|uniref:Reverse transcriptase domain-containing protein n=1 Tax=Opisthorchis viverrini TaxID=6198 RepID=A0A075A7B2_OPIVI|nr:hypothetical protein T265_00103 [Opisthorchis viverrini]KER34252.1 hypothetical protein T265_00103 [Opisthorchis viverrini]
MRRTLEGLQNPGVQIASEENLVDLEYADDIVLMFEEEEKAQVFLDELTKVIPSFGMHFAPTKCKVMLADVQSLNTPLTTQGEVLEVVERFKYLGSCISSDCSVTDEVNARICKDRAAFANLRHLWPQNGLSLNLKGHLMEPANQLCSITVGEGNSIKECEDKMVPQQSRNTANLIDGPYNAKSDLASMEFNST